MSIYAAIGVTFLLTFAFIGFITVVSLIIGWMLNWEDKRVVESNKEDE